MWVYPEVSSSGGNQRRQGMVRLYDSGRVRRDEAGTRPPVTPTCHTYHMYSRLFSLLDCLRAPGPPPLGGGGGWCPLVKEKEGWSPGAPAEGCGYSVQTDRRV